MKNDSVKEQIDYNRSGKRTQKVTDEVRAFLIETIEVNPMTTLKQLAEIVQSQLEISLNQPTISKVLQGALITLKNAQFVTNTANNLANKTRRKEYVGTLLNYRSERMPVVFVDETNFNLFISRTQGRSQSGTRVNTMRPTSKDRNIHLIGAIGTNGFSNFKLQRGSFTSPLANEYLRQCLRAANEFFSGQPVVMVIDNAPCHSEAEDIFWKMSSHATNYCNSFSHIMIIFEVFCK